MEADNANKIDNTHILLVLKLSTGFIEELFYNIKQNSQTVVMVVSFM